MQVLQKQKEFAHFQHAFYIRVNVDAYCIVILNCFGINESATKFICCLKFKHLNLALVGGVFQYWTPFSQCSGPMSKPRFSVLSNNNKFTLKVSENRH